MDVRTRDKFQVVVAAMVRPYFYDELLEWVEWHSHIGVQHFFLYDDTGGRTLTEFMGADPRITWVNFVDHAPRRGCLDLYQTEVLSRILVAVRASAEWIAFIDDDEFIVPGKNNLNEILSKMKQSGAVGLELFLRTFGTHSHVKKPEGGVLENYLTWQPRYLTKTIARTEFIHDAKRLNSLLYVDGKQPVYIDGSKRQEPVTADVLRERLDGPIYGNLWINHYVTRSIEHLRQKVDRGCMTKPITGYDDSGKPVYESKYDADKTLRWGKQAQGMKEYNWAQLAPETWNSFRAKNDYLAIRPTGIR
tara:strand:- start:681 stop:1595 length:915 start_codon:yes stop_codon:yes gene_type:complete